MNWFQDLPKKIGYDYFVLYDLSFLDFYKVTEILIFSGNINCKTQTKKLPYSNNQQTLKWEDDF